MTKPTKQDVADLLALKKSLIRIMEWTDRPSNKTPRWLQFESKCYLGSTMSEEVTFRAHYRPAGIQHRGAATINIPEAFYISLSLREHRVAALDTLVGQSHTNKVVAGRPWSGMAISTVSHWHLWTTARDGYAEPVEPPTIEAEVAVAYFCNRVNLWLNGGFTHPMRGQSGQLL